MRPGMMTLAESVIPAFGTKPLIRDASLVFAGSLLIAALAQVMIPIGMVPVSGSTLGVMLVGSLLGSRRGAAAVIAYLIEGLAGLPVFSGFSMGAAVLLGTTGGYLLGFIPAAFVTGWLAERGWDRRFFSACAAMLIGNAVVFAVGVPWLAAVLGWDWGAAWRQGVVPFVPLDAGAKVLLAASLLPLAWHASSSFRRRA